MYVYMQVTDDKYELPIYVCDSVPELSKLSGRTNDNIHCCLSKVKSGRSKKSIFVKVDIGECDGEEEEAEIVGKRKKADI